MYKLFIDGQWVKSSDGITADSINPATGEIFAKTYIASKDDVLRAIDSAHSAAKTWGVSLASEREILLLRVYQEIEERSDEICDILIDESGSVVNKSRQEIFYVLDLLRSAIGDVRHAVGETYPVTKQGQISMSIRRPLGVVAGISPFNSPFVLSMKKLVLAIAAGNTFILKPSEETPVLGALIAELFDRAGCPPGVLNVIPTTPQRIGDILTSDPRIKLITFTGSTATGKKIASQAAIHLKKFNLEMGGKSPLIILDDADINYAVNAAVAGVFYHQGQQCMAGSKIIIEDGVFDEFCERFVSKTKSLIIGDPRNPETYIGPLIRSSQCEYIHRQIKDAISLGAKLLTGGESNGNFFEPTVLTDVTSKMKIYYEESFGPVVSLIRVADICEALSVANDNEYGLSAGVITNDLKKAWELAVNVECGMFHINSNTFSDEPHVPFGGIKNSGFGREGGRYSWEELTELKWITLQKEDKNFSF
ncbi:phenylacetaldehyde dehydrogenase [Tatumella morbirosei]|uniref:Salicylaldehyde dehydrogenase n=1 Tax=Tatumella morbirosei TaxID=642227 RepID=A0A095TD72_9GAMM|nr:phenylacetaldehyde dehydrogenase [Tatumella morbirosei]